MQAVDPEGADTIRRISNINASTAPTTFALQSNGSPEEHSEQRRSAGRKRPSSKPTI
jgi:hypothetical protein